MCVSAPKAIKTSGVIWSTYDWLNKFYSCYTPTVVIIVNGCGLVLVCLLGTNPVRVSWHYIRR